METLKSKLLMAYTERSDWTTNIPKGTVLEFSYKRELYGFYIICGLIKEGKYRGDSLAPLLLHRVLIDYVSEADCIVHLASIGGLSIQEVKKDLESLGISVKGATMIGPPWDKSRWYAPSGKFVINGRDLAGKLPQLAANYLIGGEWDWSISSEGGITIFYTHDEELVLAGISEAYLLKILRTILSPLERTEWRKVVVYL